MTGYGQINQMTRSDANLFAALTRLTVAHGIDYGIDDDICTPARWAASAPVFLRLQRDGPRMAPYGRHADALCATLA